MSEEEFDELINTIPKVENDNPISSMNNINVEDLRNAVERLKKIPTYQDLLKENQELNKKLEENRNTYLLRLDSVITNYKNQQKEFIELLKTSIANCNKYLNNKDNDWDEDGRGLALTRKFAYEEILSKFKEIIGADDENL